MARDDDGSREVVREFAEDYQRMRKVTGYVHRHLVQRPAGNVTHTRWRYSLMNWGHDPLQDGDGRYVTPSVLSPPDNLRNVRRTARNRTHTMQAASRR